MNSNFESIKKNLKEILKEKRYIHTLSVVEEGIKLNETLNLGFSKDQVSLACLLHDCAKNNEREYFERFKDKYNLSEDLFDSFFDLHAKLAPIVCEEVYGCNDLSIKEAIRVHTKGKVGMNDFDKLIYLADAIDSTRDYEGIEKIRFAGYKNLNLGVLASMDNTIKFVSKRKVIDKETQEIREGVRKDLMQEKLKIVIDACEDKIAEDIKTIEIGEKTSIADYFVLATGGSVLQTQAIANEIEEKVEKVGFEVLSKEGFRDGSWILIDLGDIIVHVFTKEQREFYNLEKLWD